MKPLRSLDGRRWKSCLGLTVGALLWLPQSDAQEVASATPPAAPPLAQRIKTNPDLAEVLAQARELLKGSLNAGSGYPEVWIRDLATFMELACQVNDPAEIRSNLVLILRFQGEDGNIPDGVGHRNTSAAPAPDPQATPAPLKITERFDRLVIERPDIPDYVAFKNSVETDQESSLVLAVSGYLKATGDRAFLQETVDGKTVRQRLEMAMEFPLKERWSQRYFLIYGGTTIDWGDIAPEDRVGAVLGPASHRAIDIYDNALYLLAIDALVPMLGDEAGGSKTLWVDWAKMTRGLIRQHLWDAKRGKFIPHLYLDESPFPKDFDESAMWYHGGTAVAIQAGLLSREEVLASLAAMRGNVRAAGGLTVGLTNYPPYPKGFFLNPQADPWIYQNGGDWDWFGARMVQALMSSGCPEEAYAELLPMVARVKRHGGFYEWFDMQDHPQGSARFKGSAGELGSAILWLQEWAESAK